MVWCQECGRPLTTRLPETGPVKNGELREPECADCGAVQVQFRPPRPPSEVPLEEKERALGLRK
jgi:hypothetical protein